MEFGGGSLRVWLVAVLATAGCRQLLGFDEPAPRTPDAPIGDSREVDAAGIHLTGFTRSIDLSGIHPLANVALEWQSSTSMIMTGVMTTSDSLGAFSIDIPRDPAGAADGALHAQDATYRDTYFYLPEAIDTDVSGLEIHLTTQSTFNQMLAAASVSLVMTDGAILLTVINAQGNPVINAMANSIPLGTIRYNAGGVPSSSAIRTAVDGVAYILNLTPGSVQATASKAGLAFAVRTVEIHSAATTETATRALP